MYHHFLMAVWIIFIVVLIVMMVKDQIMINDARKHAKRNGYRIK